MKPLWTILIATLAYRQAKLHRLLSILGPQLEQLDGRVTVLALRNSAERPVGEIRQDLMDAAESEYVSFIDDDDTVPGYHVSKVAYGIMAWGTRSVDYVGWRMQAYENHHALKPTYHSLRYDRWYEDENGFYRDISHLNPVRRELTAGTTFRGGSGEDRDWVRQMRGRLKVESELYIEDCMYHYWHDTQDTVQYGILPRPAPPLAPVEAWCPHFSWHPASLLLWNCAPTATSMSTTGAVPWSRTWCGNPTSRWSRRSSTSARAGASTAICCLSTA